MKHLDQELNRLKKDTIHMMDIVKNQLEKSEKAFFTQDKGIAREITLFEKQINALDLKIDHDCENIFALYNPVAVDLRFVLSILKINFHLERIGDNVEGIAYQVIDNPLPYEKELLEKIGVARAFEIAHSMLVDVMNSLEKENTSISRSVLEKDHLLNQINASAHKVVAEYIKEKNDGMNFEKYYFLISMVKKLERIGDLLTNVAEEIIFYIDAKVLRHKKQGKP